MSLTNGFSAQLLTNAIDDETVSVWVDVRGYSNLTFYVSGTGTTSSGVLTFEEMAPPDMKLDPMAPEFSAGTGDYASITTKNASEVSAGKQVAVRATVGAYYYVRARVSTVIGGGGSVSVGLVAC